MNQTKYKITSPGVQQIHIAESGVYVVEIVVPEAEAEIHGVFRARQQEEINVEVIIHHRAPRTRAQTTLKGVGWDQSKIRFLGRIIIDPECGQTNSFLTERILLLSDQAKAEAIPELEILTDDVKCSHAASVSSLPESQLFYLQSRGIPRSQAEELVVDGFLEEQD